MKELRIYFSPSAGLIFYEVVPKLFIQSDTLLNATRLYQHKVDLGKAIGQSYEDMWKDFPDIQLKRPNPRELRDFSNTGGYNPFELIPGHAVFAPNRAYAEDLYRRQIQDGSSPALFGAKIDGSFLRSYQVDTSVFVFDYNKYGIELESEESHTVVLWEGEYGEPYWEVAPGKIVGAGTVEQAQERYAQNPTAWTHDVKEIDFEVNKTGFTGPIPPPTHIGPKWTRRFVDKDHDLVWLLKTGAGQEVLIYGDSPDAAGEELVDLEEDNGDDMETPQETVQLYAPLVEIFETGGVSEPFTEWPPPWSFAQAVSSTQDGENTPPSQAQKEVEMPMQLNANGSISDTGARSEDEQSGRKRPMALETLKDTTDRTWYELPNGRWLCEVEMPRSERTATGAWNLWRDTGFDSYLGFDKKDMLRNYGPLQHPSMEFLDEEGVDFGGTFSTTSHCACARGSLTEDQEEAKRLKVGSYTHCIDCGKLRP